MSEGFLLGWVVVSGIFRASVFEEWDYAILAALFVCVFILFFMGLVY